MTAREALVACIRAAWEFSFAPTLLRAGFADAACSRLSQIINGYSEPSRAYHSLSHVASCVTQATELRTEWRKPRAAVAALLYHDVVYDAKSKSNEEDSAALAAAAVTELIVPEARCAGGELDADEVVRLIMLTKHSAEPKHDDADGKLLIDIDLSVLGASEAEFDAYDAGIRKEYAHVPADAYRAGRAAVLRSFLAREHIFLTERYRARLEAPARANLGRAIARLDDASIPLPE